jgi:AmiR/NasT family two-component response regulator
MAGRAARRIGEIGRRVHEEDRDTMTVGSSLGLPAAPVQGFGALTVIDQLHAQIRSAEDRAAGLERALTSNRRIGMAVGILMARHQLTEDKAIAVLKCHSQQHNIKLRELAETVILMGTT